MSRLLVKIDMSIFRGHTLTLEVRELRIGMQQMVSHWSQKLVFKAPLNSVGMAGSKNSIPFTGPKMMFLGPRVSSTHLTSHGRH